MVQNIISNIKSGVRHFFTTENITIDISPLTRIAYNFENLWDDNLNLVEK